MDRPSRGGGLVVYLKSEYPYKTLISNISTNGIEQLWVIININSVKIALGVVYRPPSVSARYLSEVSNSIEQIYLETDCVIMTGDLNINLLRQSTDHILLSSMLSEFNMQQIVQHPTRVTHQTESLIDVICISENIAVNCSNNIDLEGNTDHLLTYVTFKVKPNTAPEQLLFYRDYKNFDTEQFHVDASQINWLQIDNIADLNSRVDYLNIAIINLFNKNAPIRTIKISRNIKPFITHNLKQILTLKKKAYNKYVKLKTPSSRQYYVQLRNFAKNAVNNERQAYMKFVLKQSEGNQKLLWNKLKSWGVSTKKVKHSLPQHLREPYKINNFFLNSAGNTSIDLNEVTYFKNNKLSGNTFSLKEVNDNDIFFALAQIKSEAYGHDGVNIKMVNLILPYCLPLIRNLFNDSIKQGTMPDCWKMADIIPLPKCQNPQTLNDLRPISILPVFSKMLEKLVAKQLIGYLEDNKILPPIQSGFRKHYSTATALLKVSNDIASAYDKSLSCILVLLDQSKAFDLVSDELLLAKLSYIRLDPLTLDWFQSYLCGRRQRVKIDQHKISDFELIKRGVPQGSILGPILFSIFTCDLPYVLKHASVHLYADDIQIYKSCSVRDIERTITLLNTDLDSVSKWCKRNGLKLNATKTVAMCIGTQHRRSLVCNSNLSMDGIHIRWTECTKNLGVIIDSRLSFDKHVDHIYKTTFFKLKSLYHLKDKLSQETKLKLVKTLIYPHVDYCCMAYYYFSYAYSKQKIQRIQNACMRFVCNIPYRHHVTPYLVMLNEHTMIERITYLSLVLLHKIYHTREPSYLYSLLIRRSDMHNINIRINSFTLPQHTTVKYEGSFEYLASYLLNSVLSKIEMPLSAYKAYIKDFVRIFTGKEMLVKST